MREKTSHMVRLENNNAVLVRRHETSTVTETATSAAQNFGGLHQRRDSCENGITKPTEADEEAQSLP